MSASHTGIHANLIPLVDQASKSRLGATRMNVQIGDITYYLRIGPRLLDGELTNCLQIGNAWVDTLKRRKGSFTRSLVDLRKLDLPIYLDEVTNKGFGDALLRAGHKLVSTNVNNSSRNILII